MPALEAHSSPSPSTEAAPLSLVIDGDNQQPATTYARRLSDSSSPSSESPIYQSAVDATTPLILIHDDDDEDDRDVERPLALDFSSSDEENDDLDEALSPLYQINGKLSIPPLPPFTIFIYLLSPYLKLGALLLPYYQLPLKYGLSGFIVSAILAAISRHLLYLLARYLRKADLEDVVSNTFVSTKKRGKKGERRREIFRFLVRFGTAALRVFLAVTYLHECVHFIRPLLFNPPTLSHKSFTDLGLACGTIVLALLLSYPGSLASRLVIYTTYLSILTFLFWLSAITYLHTQGTLPINPLRFTSRNIWDGLVTTAFIFTSSNTLPLYASTKGTIQPLLFDTDTALALPTGGTSLSAGNTRISRQDRSQKQPLYRSFKFLSLLSIAMAVGLVLPLVCFAAFPNEVQKAPATVTELMKGHALDDHPEQFPDWKFPFPPGDSTPATRIQTYITPALASLTLLFGVPQLLITIPTFPTGSFKWLYDGGHRYGSTSELLAKIFVIFKKSALALSMIVLTLIAIYFDLSTTIRSLTATFAILATYYVPAILHVLAHTFKSPLSIILPSTYFSSPFSASSTPRLSISNLPVPVPSRGLGAESHNVHGNADYPTLTSARSVPTTISPTPSSSRHRHTRLHQGPDELLQRKERSLQKRQMRRRLIWDLCAWGIFFSAFVVLGLKYRMVGPV